MINMRKPKSPNVAKWVEIYEDPSPRGKRPPQPTPIPKEWGVGPLKSTFFRTSSTRNRLQQCADNHPSHIGRTFSPHGVHVEYIQTSVMFNIGVISKFFYNQDFAQAVVDQLDLMEIENGQWGVYDGFTAGRILYFKKQLLIINKSYQNKADDITGIMTIRALDSFNRMWDSTDEI